MGASPPLRLGLGVQPGPGSVAMVTGFWAPRNVSYTLAFHPGDALISAQMGEGSDGEWVPWVEGFLPSHLSAGELWDPETYSWEVMRWEGPGGEMHQLPNPFSLECWLAGA